jgi:anti-sigma regulatory factor (Ser/Thr protein kinase)
MSASTQIILQNDLAELDRLNELVAEFGGEHGFTVEEEYAIYLCLEELFSNVVNYAWPEGGEHQVEVRLMVDDESLKIQLEDDGIPFNPTEYPEPDTSKPAHERQIGGLGIHLVRQNADQLWYQRQDNKNVLILKKKRKTAPAHTEAKV